jgi:hypothetical protein
MTQEKIEVKVGQVWKDYDIRSRSDAGARLIKILSIENGKATVQCPTGRGRKTKVRLDRFRPTSTGYALVTDV